MATRRSHCPECQECRDVLATLLPTMRNLEADVQRIAHKLGVTPVEDPKPVGLIDQLVERVTAWVLG